MSSIERCSLFRVSFTESTQGGDSRHIGLLQLVLTSPSGPLPSLMDWLTCFSSISTRRVLNSWSTWGREGGGGGRKERGEEREGEGRRGREGGGEGRRGEEREGGGRERGGREGGGREDLHRL